jgi:glutamyl-tRNA reductase
MWQNLSLVHGKPETLFPASALVWRTCLRQVQFLLPGSVYGQPIAGGEMYSGTQAHRFLVEVCAGLHSPLLGETEIFGQFKSFRDQSIWHSAWDSLLDAVEEDVKKIRRNFLTNLGSQSYGSLTRKRLPEGTPVVVVGAGRLAQDILPWLDKHEVTVLARNPAKVLGWKGKVASFEDVSSLPASASWIVAAPISNDALQILWLAAKPGTVLDFRGESRIESCPGSEYFDLTTLFSELELIRTSLAARREQAMKAVENLSATRESVVVHRPYGWEDAFA